MSSLLIGKPPPGVNLSEDRQVANNATVIAVLAIATVAVGLRCWARLGLRASSFFGIDDWFTLIALVFCYATGICCILGSTYGIGKHVWVVSPDNVEKSMKVIFAYVILYANTVPMVKLSVLLLYHRIFDLKWSLYFCAFLSIGYAISVSLVISFANRPSSFFWTQWVNPLSGGKTMVNLYNFYLANAICNLFIDVLILSIPAPIVWKLQMPKGQKLAILGIFLLGGFVCIASIVRIYSITKLSGSVDITWAIGDAMVWSNVEPCIGLVSACLPTLRPLLREALTPFFGPLWRRTGNSRTGNMTPGNNGNADSGVGISSKSRTGKRGEFVLLGSKGNNGKGSSFRPEDDEAYLTTDIGHAGSGTDIEAGGKGSKRGYPLTRESFDQPPGQDSIPLGITVKSDVHWDVRETHQRG